MSGADEVDPIATILVHDQALRFRHAPCPNRFLGSCAVKRKGQVICIHESHLLLFILHQLREPVLHMGARVQDAHFSADPPPVLGHLGER